MCLAIPARIVAVEEGGHFATVEVSGVRRKVNMDLVREEGADVDTWVLLHVGFAMSVISEADAEDQIRLLTMMGEAGAAREEIEGYRFAPPDPGGP